MRVGDGDALLVCHTRDISREGCFLDTVEHIDAGAHVHVALINPVTGDVVEVEGTVMRALAPMPDGTGRGVGIQLVDPDETWDGLIAAQVSEGTLPGVGARAVRLRVVVVGSGDRRRGALALYVTSGWDVRFASDVAGVQEAMSGFHVDAIIAEQDLDDPLWRDVLAAARDAQPEARRIVRAPLRGRTQPEDGGATDLVHRVVDEDAGLDALLDALTADFGARSPAPRGHHT